MIKKMIYPSVFLDQCLKDHNLLRARHENTPPLKWNRHLAKEAEEWAKHLLSIRHMVHAHVKGEGENLYYSVADHIANCGDAVQAWYELSCSISFSRKERTRTFLFLHCNIVTLLLPMIVCRSVARQSINLWRRVKRMNG